MRPVHVPALLGIVLSAAPAAGSPTDPVEKENARLAQAALGKDARLQEKVTLAWKDLPVGEAVAGLAKELKAPLAAGPETADDKVTFFAKDRPAFEVLTLLARHFDFQWYRSASRCVLTQNAGARRREQALREAESAGRLSHDVAHMAGVARLADLSREQLAARERETADGLQAPGLAAGDRSRLTSEQQALADLQRPGGRAAGVIWRLLEPQQLRELREQGELRLSTVDGRLPPAITDLVRQGWAISSRGG